MMLLFYFLLLGRKWFDCWEIFLDENEVNDIIDDNPIEEEDEEEDSADEGPSGRKRKMGVFIFVVWYTLINFVSRDESFH